MKNLLLSLFVIASIQMYSQSLTPEVISSGGDYFESANASISWTLGECMIETYSGSNAILTQGFQQTNLNITDIEENFPSGINCSLFPNPTGDELNVKINGYENIHPVIYLFDMSGKQLLTKEINSDFIKIDFSNYKSGTYVLKISDSKEKISSTYHIIKAK